MILSVAVLLKDIYEKGREYLWPRPAVCPRCKAGRLWGHGFVPAYFDGFESCIWLRRYRCAHCGCVVRLKPEGYLERFQASTEAIRSAISDIPKRKQSFISRPRRAHWVKALKRKAVAYFGNAFGLDLLEAFDRLLAMGRIPVSRSIQFRSP